MTRHCKDDWQGVCVSVDARDQKTHVVTELEERLAASQRRADQARETTLEALDRHSSATNTNDWDSVRRAASRG